MQHPRNQILQLIADTLAPMVTEGHVTKADVSLQSFNDGLPVIAIRSAAETVERIDSEFNQRELFAAVMVTVHADDTALTLLDDLSVLIESYVADLRDIAPAELYVTGVELTETQFPEQSGDELGTAVLIFRVTNHTPI